ncbi:hypothetical protein BH11MYX1_BH11MYX1_06820 [soil metagenome]
MAAGMNRRVLLIDADPGFRDTLTRELARYRVVVMTEPDSDRALALANSEAPAMVILCIEEADKKAGFRVFEKCKKGSLSKVPIVLVTGSVPADSFAKHRSLKVHADEYLDKRTMSTHELVGKIDGLIALGDPEEEDLSIPVEDEVPMEIADGDVVLDEVLGDLDEPEPQMLAHDPELAAPEVHDEFDQHDARTVGPQDALTVDSVVNAETDAAFDALMGGFGDEPDPAPTAQAVAEAGEHREASIAMPPMAPELSPVDLALADADETVSVPEPILDGRGRGTTPPPLVSSVPAIIIDRPPLTDAHHGRTQAIGSFRDLPEAVPEPVPHHADPDPEPVVAESMSESIDLDALDEAAANEALPDRAPVEQQAAYDDDLAEDVIDDSPFGQSTDMYEAAEEDGVPLDGLGEHPESAPAVALDDEELVPMLDVEEALAMEVEVEPPDETPEERRARSSGRTIVPQLEPHEATAIAPIPTAAAVPMPPIVAEYPPESSRPTLSRTSTSEGSHPAIDLGLDAVADDARSEQSGVYDRRALRKIGELERQIAQLKTELERAHSAGETATKGGSESQFLHLREGMLAKEKDLTQAKTDLDARDAALADATARMHAAETTKAALEAKQAELDKRATEEAAKAQKLTAAAKQSEGQLAQLQQEVERLTKTGATAESARAQLEKELATERAAGKASASEAERLLRTERDQLVQRHSQELATARAEIEAAKQGSDTRAREEREALARNHEAVLAAAQQARDQLASDHAAALAATHQQHQAALSAAERQRDQLAREHQAALVVATSEAEAALDAQHEQLQRAHAAALEQHAEELRAASAGDHVTALAALAQQHDRAIVALEADHAGEQSKLSAELQTTRQAHDDAITRMMGEHAAALEDRSNIHAATLEERSQAHAAELAEIVRVHETNLADAERSRAALLAEATQGAAAAAGERERALAAQARTHDQELAVLQATHEAALDAQHGAASEAIAEHEAAAEAAAEAHAAELATTRTELERATAVHEVKLGAARREHETEIGRHDEARRDLEQAHRSATEQLAAAHRDQLAAATAERDQLAVSHQRAADAHQAALADATEHYRTDLADREAQHDRALHEATTRHASELQAITASANQEVAEHKAATAAAKRVAEEAAAAHAVASDAATKAHAQALAEAEAKRARELAAATSDFTKQKSVSDAEHARAIALAQADADKARAHLVAEHDKAAKELVVEREELKRGLSGARDSLKRSEGELASAVQSIADRNAELRQHASAVAERDTRIAELRKEIEGLETENTSYQDQVLRAYQKIKTDEAMVARARKAMAIALTVLDDQGTQAPTEKPKT